MPCFQPFDQSALQLHDIALHFHSTWFIFFLFLLSLFIAYFFYSFAFHLLFLLLLLLLFESIFYILLFSIVSCVCVSAHFFIFRIKESIHRERLYVRLYVKKQLEFTL